MAIEVPPPEAIPDPTLAAPSLLSGGRAISLALLAISVIFAVSGQVTLKAAMNEIGRIGGEQMKKPMETVVKAIKEPRLWVGLALFGISSVFWLVVLSRVSLSIAYPLVGLSYIVVVAISRFFLHEHVPPMRWLGVIVIALGIALIGISLRRAGA
ncbi:MAG TPA: EamA family transporter [Actinomycetota bacterium]|nr:EamA family transporter [Actinomycetota bacterium]